MTISQKLTILVAIPLIAFLSVSFIYTKQNIDEAQIVESMSLNAKLFIAASDLIHELQRERGRSSVFLSGGSREDMEAQRSASDRKIAPLLAACDASTLPEKVIADVRDAVSDIARVRTSVDNGCPSKEAVDKYTQIINELMGAESAVGSSKTTRGFGKALTTIIILETAKENAGKLRATAAGILTANKPIDEELFERLITFKANIDSNLNSQALALSKDARPLLESSRGSESWADVNKTFNTILMKSKEGDYGVSGKEFFATITKVIDDLGRVRSAEVAFITANLSRIYDEIRADLIKVFVSIAVTLALTIGIAIPLAMSITKPIALLIGYAKRVADGDLDANLSGKFSQELDSLKQSLAAMVSSLKVTIAEATESSRKAESQSEKVVSAMREAEDARKHAERAKAEGMLDAAQRIEGVVEIVTSASEELSAQIEQSTRGTGIQSSRISETATAMEEMNATVLEVATNASRAAESADQARDKAQQGSTVVTQVVKGIGEVQQSALVLKNDMTMLGRQAESIGQILNVISDIADQTNLLALNAAIEAARAGDAGRGFAVVADEVRKLAEKTMTATKQVGDAIREIQNGTKVNVDSVERAVTLIDEATRLANQSGEALTSIVNLVDTTTDQVRSIATASEEQSAASEEITRSIDDVNRIATENADGMNQSAQAVAELARQAMELKTLVEQMKADAI